MADATPSAELDDAVVRDMTYMAYMRYMWGTSAPSGALPSVFSFPGTLSCRYPIGILLFIFFLLERSRREVSARVAP